MTAHVDRDSIQRENNHLGEYGDEMADKGAGDHLDEAQLFALTHFLISIVFTQRRQI